MSTTQGNHPREINAGRLFTGSCLALIATAVPFAIVGDVMGPLKEFFVLTNQQVGWIGGAGLLGFSISIFVFGPLCDTLGMRTLLTLAFIANIAGVLSMIFASGFQMLYLGCLSIAMANGLIEAACNPLVATLYPTRKAEKLNHFHMWFPGGIVIGGLISFLMDKGPATYGPFALWQVKLSVILVPTLIYGFMLLREKYPETERVQSGVSYLDMLKGVLFRPLFIVLLLCMGITASIELGPNRWIPAVLKAGHIPGILVLVWISGLMAVLRMLAGPVIHKLAPTGILLASSLIAGVGLYWFSFADSVAMAFVSATVFAIGVCYFWPTMLGITAERVPKGGAVALALLGGFGNLIVGTVASPQMGHIADYYAHSQIPVQQTIDCLHRAFDVLPAPTADKKPAQYSLAEAAHESVKTVLDATNAAGGTLPPESTENALRAIISSGISTPEGKAIIDEAQKILDPADNYGGRMSFRYVAPFSIILILVFGTIWLSDRRRGGYKVESIRSH